MLRLRKGSHRNTQCHIVNIGPHTFYFSYETCMAYAGPASERPIRRANHWGPTTARHMNDMGCAAWTTVDDATLDAILDTPTHT